MFLNILLVGQVENLHLIIRVFSKLEHPVFTGHFLVPKWMPTVNQNELQYCLVVMVLTLCLVLSHV